MTDAAVTKYLEGIGDEGRRRDVATVMAMMEEATGEAPRMWGNIVGFGSYHYRYESGREGDTFVVGIASRKDSMVLYLGPGMDENTALVQKLGRHRAGKGCLYVKRMSDVDAAVLRDLLQLAAGWRYGI
jgi:hypothetical protein